MDTIPNPSFSFDEIRQRFHDLASEHEMEHRVLSKGGGADGYYLNGRAIFHIGKGDNEECFLLQERWLLSSENELIQQAIVRFHNCLGELHQSRDGFPRTPLHTIRNPDAYEQFFNCLNSFIIELREAGI